MKAPDEILQQLREAGIKRARDLTDWVALLHGLDEWLDPTDELIRRSGRQDLRQALTAADWIASTYDQRFHARLFDAWADQLDHEPGLVELAAVCVSTSRWENLFNDAYGNYLVKIERALQASVPGSAPPPELNETLTTCRIMRSANVLCAQSAPLLITDILCLMTDPDLFLTFLEAALQQGLSPADHDRLIAKGVALGIDSSIIYQLLGDALEQIKLMIENNQRDAKRLGNLVLLVKNMPAELARALAEIAQGCGNLEGLAALLALNMEAVCDVLTDDEIILQSLGFKGIGRGKNLLVQWHQAKRSLRSKLRERIKQLVREELIKLSVAAASRGGGSLDAGLIPRNELRRFRPSDDLDLLNIEETLDALVSSGKGLEELREDDLFVHDTAKGQAALTVLIDISGSMSGEDLAQCSIASLLLVMRVRGEELALAAFESNTHVMKGFADNSDVATIADQVLELEATGGTCVDRALEWAAEQFESTHAPMKVLFLLSDFYFSESQDALTHHLHRLANAHVKLLAASHSLVDKKLLAHFLEHLPGDHLRITNLETLPDLLNRILSGFADR